MEVGTKKRATKKTSRQKPARKRTKKTITGDGEWKESPWKMGTVPRVELAARKVKPFRTASGEIDHQWIDEYAAYLHAGGDPEKRT